MIKAADILAASDRGLRSRVQARALIIAATAGLRLRHRLALPFSQPPC